MQVLRQFFSPETPLFLLFQVDECFVSIGLILQETLS